MSKSDNIRLSAVMIVKNEERVLETTLSALRPVVDEIVVADTGSVDASMAIASRFADQLVSIDWQDDFAAARNAALAYATGDWVLSIDADEVIRNPDQARAALQCFASQRPGGVIGYIDIVSATRHGQATGKTRSRVRRFFPRRECVFNGIIHEQIDARQGPTNTASTGVVVDHSGYDQDMADPAHKAHRNIRLLKKALQSEPLHHYYHFQLGQSHFTLEAYEPAITSFSRALALMEFRPGQSPTSAHGPVPREYLTTLLTSLGNALINLQRYTDARTLIDQHTALDHHASRSADLCCLSGYLAMKQGDVLRARADFRQALEHGPANECIAGCGSYLADYHLGLLAEAEKDARAVTEHHAACLRAKPDYVPSLQRYVDFIVAWHLEVDQAIVEAAHPGTFRAVFEHRLERAARAEDQSALAVLNAVLARLQSSCPAYTGISAQAA